MYRCPQCDQLTIKTLLVPIECSICRFGQRELRLARRLGYGDIDWSTYNGFMRERTQQIEVNHLCEGVLDDER